MKKFSDLLDINFNLDIKITISPIVKNGCPGSMVSLNDHILHCGILTQRLTMHASVGLTEPIKIEVEMKDKKYDQNLETALIIDELTIDGMEIIPNYVHLATYHNERGLELFTNYLGFNGSWVLDINEPFYQWRHRVTGQGWLLEPSRA